MRTDSLMCRVMCRADQRTHISAIDLETHIAARDCFVG